MNIVSKASEPVQILEYCKPRIAVFRHQRHAVTRMLYCREIYTCDLDFLCNGCLSSSGTWEVLKEESSASVYWLSSIFLILRLSVKCLIWSRAESPILYSSSLYLKWTNRRAQRIFFSFSVCYATKSLFIWIYTVVKCHIIFPGRSSMHQLLGALKGSHILYIKIYFFQNFS